MHKATIAGFNQDVDSTCSYCMGPDGSTDHVRWECKHFQPKRVELDKDIAALPLHHLPMNIRSGIAPAMKHDGKATFWGKKIDDDLDESTKRLLGQDMELHKGGKDAEEIAGREDARELLEDPENKNLNARQVVMKYKQAHGSGVDLAYPTKQEIDSHMEKNGYDNQHLTTIYGDGSHTSPTNWWAALGGFGIWIPPGQQHQRQHQPEAIRQGPCEESHFGAALGQTGSSTRQELMAWLRVLALPIRSFYATDSAALLRKATRLIDAVRAVEKEDQAYPSCKKEAAVRGRNPFGKPWGLQKDGDLWEQAWNAVRARGADSQRLRKVKGHATAEDVAAGRSTEEDRIGNDRSDTNADRGVECIHGKGLVVMAGWLAKRHKAYKKFIERIHNFIVGLAKAEKEERMKKTKVDQTSSNSEKIFIAKRKNSMILFLSITKQNKSQNMFLKNLKKSLFNPNY